MKYLNIQTKILAIFLALCFSSSAFSAVDLDYDKRIGMEGLYFWYADGRPAATFNREISPKGDCFDIVNGYAFLVWYKGGMNKRNLMLSRMKIGTNKWKTIQFSQKNTLFTGKKRGKNFKNAGNSHKTAAVGISPKDGTIHITFDMHGSTLKYIVSKKNIAFGSDANFKTSNFNKQRNYLRSGTVVKKFTYPNFNTNAAGELIMDYRVGETRGGDRVMAFYNGNVWSTPKTLIKGDGANPEFNTYGQLANFNGVTYLHGAIRVKGSPINLNQGVYYARAGLRGNEPWSNVKGSVYSLPVRSVDQMKRFKVGEPIKKNSEKMGTGQSFVATESGALHFTGAVRDTGPFHYYKKSNSDKVVKGKAGPVSISFAAGGRVYGVALSGGDLLVQSTDEDESRWRTDYKYSRVDIGAFKAEFYKGKLYIIAAEKKESDKRPFRQIVLDVNAGSFKDKPTVYFSNPTGNTIKNRGYKMYTKVIAKAASGSIKNVKMYINGNFVRQENKAPYEWGHFGKAKFPKELDGLPKGNHELRVVATDSKGLKGENSIILKVK